MSPGGVGVKSPGDDFPGVVVGRQNERLQQGSGPPLVRRGIVLEEFSNSSALPAPTRFGTRRQLGDQVWVQLFDVQGHRRAGADKGKAGAELIGQKGVIEWL